MPVIKIYTDGACSGNPGPGGYGAVIISNGTIQKISEGYFNTTNNRMELLGVIKALEKTSAGDIIELFSDSKYIVDAINKNWLRNWISTGWRLSNKKPVKNRDLWEEILSLIGTRSVKFKWVQGHSGDKYNEIADDLAQKASRKPTLEDRVSDSDNPLELKL